MSALRSTSRKAAFCVLVLLPALCLSQLCGNGRLEAVVDADGELSTSCPGVSTVASAAAVTAEACDIKTDSRLGLSTSTCSTSCQLDQSVDDAQPFAFVKAATGPAIALQHLANAPLQQPTTDYVRMCMYATQWVDSACNPVDSYAQAAGCKLSGDDFVHNPSLECYHTDANDAEYRRTNGLCVLFAEGENGGMSLTELQDLGTRNLESEISHKCVNEFSTRGDMTVASESWVPLNVTTDSMTSWKTYHQSDGVLPNMHDFCFGFEDLEYGSVEPVSQKLMPSKYTIDYKIICDPLDQAALTSEESVFGQRTNVCDYAHLPWSLMTCDSAEENCEPVVTNKHVYKNPYNTADEALHGTVYTFDHESNFFECTANELMDEQTGAAFTEQPNFLHTCSHQPRSETTGDGQAYTVGCGRRLKLWMQHGFGAIYFRVETTITSSFDPNTYSAKRSEMVGFSVKATVNPTLPLFTLQSSVTSEPSSVDASAGVVSLLDSQVFDSMLQRSESVVTDGDFSATAKWTTEYIDCTASTEIIAVEGEASVSRFDVVGLADQASLEYFASSRTYYRPVDFSDLNTLKQAQDNLKVRSATPWHDAYTNGTLGHPGICVKMRLTVYEPSSCEYASATSDPSFVTVAPSQIEASTAGTLTVRSDQEVQAHDENHVISLKINNNYTGLHLDSELFYFSHLEIEDLGIGNENETFAGDFDLFNDKAHTLNTADQSGYSDSVRTPFIVTKPSKQDTTWTTYSNAATMWLATHQAYTWGSVELETYLTDEFTSHRPCGEDTSVSRSQECLSHARTVGLDLFDGLFLRHRVGSPTTVALRMTIYAIDGPVYTASYDVASQEVAFVFLPSAVRMDQGEMLASTAYLKENDMHQLSFQAGGVRIPTVRRSEYMDGDTQRDVEICVYVLDASNGVLADHPALDASNPQYQNILCSSADGLVTGADVAYGVPTAGSDYIRHSCPHRVGYRLTCEEASNNKFTEGRIKLHEFALSDVSILTTPDGRAYQPAGNNEVAADSQWYRAEPCASSDNIDSIYWCDDNDASGVTTTGGAYATAAAAGGLCDSSEGDVNFWKVTLKADTSSMAESEICIQGLSDFNTEQTVHVKPVELEMAYSVIESVLLLDGSLRHMVSSTTRHTAESKIRMTVESVRDNAESLVLPDGKKWVMERPSLDAENSDSWSDVGVTLATGAADCDGENKAFELCLDRVLFSQRVSSFNDQFMGRMQIECQVRSTRGEHEWEPAGGLFYVPVTESSQVTQVEGYFDAAQDVKNAHRSDDAALRSHCVIEANPNATVSQSSCTFATNPHTVEDWNQSSGAYYNSIVVNDEHYWSTDVDVRFPAHWKNVEFNCSITASNEDREHLPEKCLAHNQLWEKDLDADSPCLAREHASTTRHVIVSINETSHHPYLFVENNTNAQPNAACTGHASEAGCAGKAGIKGQTRAEYKAPEEYGASLNPNSEIVSNEMMVMMVTANRLLQLRVVTGSFGSDTQADFENAVDGHEQYRSAIPWSAKAASYNAIGSRSYLTIESKHKHLTVAGQTDANLNFCVWVCPLDTPGCNTTQLRRYRPLDDSVDMGTQNVNSELYDDELLDEELSDPIHRTCPEAGVGPFRPGSRYSIECKADGRCYELQDLYISYPQSTHLDDLLEITAVERGDSRGPAHWKNVSISAFVYMTPSVHSQQVTLDAGWEADSYAAEKRTQSTVDSAVLKYRLVLQEQDFLLNGIDFLAGFDNTDGVVAGDLRVNMTGAIWTDAEKIDFCAAGVAADSDCVAYPYTGTVQPVVALSLTDDILSGSVQWADGDSRSDSKTVSVQTAANSTVWQNAQCEHAKQMLLRLRVTDGEEANANGFVLVTVTDDDFYGETRLASCSESVCTAINEEHTWNDRNVVSNVSWEAWSNVHVTPTFEIQRSKSSADDPALSAATVVLTVQTADLRPIDWSIKVTEFESYTETVVPHTDVIERSDNKYDVHIHLPVADAFQRVLVSFESSGRVDTCGVLGATDVKFTLSDVRDAQGISSQITSTCPRTVLPYSEGKPSSITVTMQSSHDSTDLENDRHPWAIDFESNSESHDVSSYPVQYDSGAKNTVVIEEAESMNCQKPTDAGCISRTVQVPICLRPQPGLADATGAMGGPLGTFVVGLEDDVTSSLSIGHNYQLRCSDEQQPQGASDVSCKRVSRLGYNDTDADGQEVIKTLVCHDDYTTFVYENEANQINDMTPTKHELYCKSQPTWLQYHISTAVGGGHDLQCGNDDAKPHFELTVFSVEERHMSYDVNVVMRNRPDTDGAATCSSFATPSLKFKVLQHSPIFVNQGYELTESHVTTFVDTVVQEVSSGGFSFTVSDQYLTAPEDEPTFVNHGFGPCPEKGTTWERSDINPLANADAMQGTCDSLDIASLRDAVTDYTDKSQSFAELYHILVTGLTVAEYNDTSIELTSALQYASKSTEGIQRTLQRSASPSSEAPDAPGYTITTETTLAAIQSCKTYTGSDVLEVTNDGDTTTYAFYAHVNKITAQHADNPNWAVHSTQCSQRKYSFSASNKIAAITGQSTQGADVDKVYVHKMGYSSQPGVCATPDTCVSTIGAQNTCRGDSADYLEAFEYTVHIDRKVVTQSNSLGEDVHMYYAVSEQDYASDILIDDDNCYGTVVKGVQVSYPVNDAGTVDTDIVRSSITFITGCQDLRDATGQVTANAFATCQSDSSRRMDFSFNASLYACSSANNLVRQAASTTPMDPRSVSVCAPLNVQPYSIKMEWLHKRSKIEASATQTVSTFVLRGDPNHNNRSPTEVVDWLAQHKLSKATASIAEGEKVNIAMCTTGAEDVSTLKLSDVSMTVSKLPCLLAPYTPTGLEGAGYAQCTQANMLQDQTHSPFVFYAMGVALDGVSSCSTQYTGSASCQPGQWSSPDSNPIPEYGLLDEQVWETFIFLELQCIHATDTTCHTTPTQDYQTLFAGSPLYLHMTALAPFAANSQKLLKGGVLTPFALKTHGDAFAEVTSETIQLTVSGQNQPVAVTYPKATGVGRCTTEEDLCHWTFLQRTATNSVSSTCDVWHMNMPSFKKGERYVFSLVAEQRQFAGGTARRLLATTAVGEQESANPFDISGFDVAAAQSSTDSTDSTDDKWDTRLNTPGEYMGIFGKHNMQSRSLWGEALNDEEKFFMRKHGDTPLYFWLWTVLFVGISLFVHKCTLFGLLLLQMKVKSSQRISRLDHAGNKTDFDEFPAGESYYHELYKLWTEGILMHRLRIVHALKSERETNYSLAYWAPAILGHLFLIYIEMATGSYYIFATIQVAIFMCGMMRNMNTGDYGVTHKSANISQSWIMRHKTNFNPKDAAKSHRLVFWSWMFMVCLPIASMCLNFLMWMNLTFLLFYYGLVIFLACRMETTDTYSNTSDAENNSLVPSSSKDSKEGKFYIP